VRKLLSLALGSLLLVGCSLQQDVSSAAPSGKVGSAAPVLTGSTVDRRAIQVDFRNTKTVLVFWAAWCGPCRHEQPGLNRIAHDFAAQGVRLLGVDVLDHDRALAAAFIQEFKVPYASLYDSSGTATAAFQVDYPPSIVLIDQRGVVVARYPGEASENQLRTMIRQKLLT
jgi:thiol-disulfide isomerase/thioredoxin